MTSKPKVKDRLAMLTAMPHEGEATTAPPLGRDRVAGVSSFLPMQHGMIAGEALTERITTLEAALHAEREERAGDRDEYERDLTRLRKIAAEAGDSAGEFALLDPFAVIDVLPADRLPGAFTDRSFEELVEDIRLHGQHDPISVRPTQTGFEIASGRRRLEACKRLGLQVLARVRTLDQEAMLAIQFSENERRQDISAIERARWLAQVKDRFGKQVQQLADDYHLDRTTVSLYLRLARFPQEIIDRLVDPRLLPMLKARRLMAALEQDPGALERVVATLDSHRDAADRRGMSPVPDDQVEVAIRVAEGRGAPRGFFDAELETKRDKRVIIHKGQRIGTLLRNGGQWVVRFAATTEDSMVMAITEAIPELIEQIEKTRGVERP